MTQILRFKPLVEEINIWEDEDFDPAELQRQTDQLSALESETSRSLDDAEIARLNSTDPRATSEEIATKLSRPDS